MADTLDPGQLQVEIERGAERLETASEGLYRAIKDHEEKEQEWERLRLQEVARIVHEAKEKGERVPGEDVRNAMVMQTHATSDAYLNHVVAKAHAEALEKSSRLLAASVNARQTLLKVMRGAS